MPSPTAGFQLSALPEPLSIPSNIGKYDISQSQLAQANAMKNAQTATLIGPETRRLLAEAQAARLQAQNQATRAQALSSFVSPAAEAEARAAIAGSEAGRLQSELESAQRGALIPGAGLLARLRQQAATNQAVLAAGSKYGVATMPFVVGDTKLTGVISSEGGVTPLGGTSLINAAVTKPSGTFWMKTGAAPITDASGKILNEWQQYQLTPLGGKVLVGKPVRSLANPSGEEEPEPAQGAPVPQPTTADSAQVVNTPWGKYPPDSRDSKAWREIADLSNTYRGVSVDSTPSQQKARAELFDENSNAIALTSQQAVAINYLQDAFNRMNQQGIKQGTISSLITNRILSPEIVGAISNSLGVKLDGAMDVNQASLAAVEKLGSDIKNLRAYAGIKELLVSAKPQATDTPDVTADKMARIRDAISLTQNRAEAINAALDAGVPVSKALRVADKYYSVSASPNTTAQTGASPGEKLSARDWLKAHANEYSDSKSAKEAYDKYLKGE